MDVVRCLCVGVILLVGFEARNVKLVPKETKTVNIDGATHEISRYIIVPDDTPENSDGRHNKGIQFEPNENARNFSTTETKHNFMTGHHLDGASSDTNYNMNGKSVHTIIKSSGRSIASGNDMKANHVSDGKVNGFGQNGESFEKVYLKSAGFRLPEKVTEEKYYILHTNTTKKHMKKEEQDKSTENSSGDLNAGEAYRNQAAQDIIDSYIGNTNSQRSHLEKVEQDKSQKSETKDRDKLSGETAGDHKYFNQIQTKTITKTIYNPETSTRFNPMISSIGINKLFTVPGMKGRFKIMQENDDDIDYSVTKTHKQNINNPTIETRSHFYMNKNYVGKTPVNRNTDTRLRSFSKIINNHDSDSYSNLDTSYVDTNTDTNKAEELTIEKSNFINSIPSGSNIKPNLRSNNHIVEIQTNKVMRTTNQKSSSTLNKNSDSDSESTSKGYLPHSSTNIINKGSMALKFNKNSIYSTGEDKNEPILEDTKMVNNISSAKSDNLIKSGTSSQIVSKSSIENLFSNQNHVAKPDSDSYSYMKKSYVDTNTGTNKAKEITIENSNLLYSLPPGSNIEPNLSSNNHIVEIQTNKEMKTTNQNSSSILNKNSDSDSYYSSKGYLPHSSANIINKSHMALKFNKTSIYSASEDKIKPKLDGTKNVSISSAEVDNSMTTGTSSKIVSKNNIENLVSKQNHVAKLASNDNKRLNSKSIILTENNYEYEVIPLTHVTETNSHTKRIDIASSVNANSTNEAKNTVKLDKPKNDQTFSAIDLLRSNENIHRILPTDGMEKIIHHQHHSHEQVITIPTMETHGKQTTENRQNHMKIINSIKETHERKLKADKKGDTMTKKVSVGENLKADEKENLRTNYANIPYLKENEIKIVMLPKINTDTFTNALKKTNSESYQMEINQTKQLNDDHKNLHSFSLRIPTKTTYSKDIGNVDKGNSNFIVKKSSNLQQIENYSEPKSYDTNLHKLEKYNPMNAEDIKSQQYPEEIQISRINNWKTTNVANEHYMKNDDTLRIKQYCDISRTQNYPVTDVQHNPYQVYGGYSTYLNNDKIIQNQNSQCLQNILNYLLSTSNLMADVNALYASTGQNIDRPQVIRQVLLAYLHKLGIYYRLSPEHIGFLVQNIQKYDQFAENNNHTVDYEVDDKPKIKNLNRNVVPQRQPYSVPYSNYATNQNIGDDAYLRQYVQDSANDNINLRDANYISPRILYYIVYLRKLRVPEYQILQFVNEVRKLLIISHNKPYKTGCQNKDYIDLAQRVDLIAKQFINSRF